MLPELKMPANTVQVVNKLLGRVITNMSLVLGYCEGEGIGHFKYRPTK